MFSFLFSITDLVTTITLSSFGAFSKEKLSFEFYIKEIFVLNETFVCNKINIHILVEFTI